MAKSLIGININPIEVTAVNGTGKVYFEQLPSNLVDETGVISPDVFVDFMKKFKKNSGMAGKDCAIVMPEGTTYFRQINSPVLSDEQIKINLPFEFKNFVGNDSDKYNYDYYLDGIEYDDDKKPTGIKLIAAAGLKETVNNYAGYFKDAGMNLKLALPSEVCLLNIMKETAEEGKEYCLIGLGYNSTNIYIFKGKDLISTKVIDLATKQIDIAIGNELGTDEYLASGFRENNHNNCLNFPSVKNIYERIGLEVMKTINFYRYEHNESELETAYFFDVSASNKAFKKAILEQISFKEGDINEVLPNAYKNSEEAVRCLISLGLGM